MKLRLLAFASFAIACGAHASVITFETATTGAGAQASAADYLSIVSGAMADASHRQTQLGLYDGVSNHAVFGGSVFNVAYMSTIDFGVSDALAGVWSLRAGVDFGRGGAVFLDGVALGFKSTDMWWNGGYADVNQSFQFSNVSISAGKHRLKIVGLEGCCDGNTQAQFSSNGRGFQTFAANDGLVQRVPEPGTLALLAGSLGALGLSRRRKR
ncbi:CCXG family PEP-CTERM protein [Paucibacter soli]|uniref:CCXG family PEP-CTERM protein n=1 Tax=Paucibacter soli TaxID=3133433 RepID=UPI0030B57BD6